MGYKRGKYKPKPKNLDANRNGITIYVSVAQKAIWQNLPDEDKSKLKNGFRAFLDSKKEVN